MRKISRALVISLVVFIVSMSALAEDPAKIWCLGDSITEGNVRYGTSYPSYRRNLSGLLTAEGMNFDFVGTRNGYTPDDIPFPDSNWLDQDHDGWGGHGSNHLVLGDYLSPSIVEMAQQVNPDIVLIHIGTNDSVFLNEASETVANIGDMIEAVRDVNPFAAFYVAQIIPIYSGSPLEPKIDAISAAIGADVPSLDTAISPVTVVDMYTGFNRAWLMDGVHPDFNGEAFLAQQWANAIEVYDPPTPGDADLDGDIDADDLATWGANYTGAAGSGKDWLNGDFDLDGDVDADDLATWGANYTGVGGGGSITAVPEPATMSLLALGGLLGLVKRKRK